ncbi:hypothetical protein XH99_34615 [Bradyrhizobium nanningense]|uniref:Uncharacterized protein n=1 Tax=Bradyrhizobium nanningense TaxID=1325118 RepID=A0A4Q0RU02_9BRAD|nr:hypothetical protein XH99_34615 [Bradyrhizobium nanningense]RXH28318.1 hypothetical protein XH84_25255 [Bradyrhizobium nanningense]
MRRARRGEAGDLDPALFALFLKVEQRCEAGIVKTFRSLHRAHVIDHVGRRQRGEDGREFGNRARLEIDVDMPAELRDAVHDALELVHVTDAAEALEEGETATADAGLVERRQLLLGHLVIDVGNALIGTLALGDGIGDDAIVGAVHGGIHDDAALDTDLLMDAAERLQRRISRVVGTLLRERVTRRRAEDVSVAIA